MATYKNLTDFLIKHHASKFKDKVVTHTKIGHKDKTKKLYGGSYVIEPDELDTFRELYYDHVIVKNNKEYLTEVQFKDGGTIAVDLDFRYNIDITERQHDAENLQDIVLMYLDCLKDAFVFDGNSKFDIFVFEKPNVNIVNEKNITKDGIHMLINIKTNHIIQQLIREKVMKNINNDVLNLPLTNSWKDVFDEGISKGTTNWQVFGSRKPDNEAYELSLHYSIEVDETDGEFMMEEKNINDFNLKDNLKLLSVQNDNLPEFPLTQLFKNKYDEKIKEFQTPIRKQKKKRLVLDEGETDTESVSSDITNMDLTAYSDMNDIDLQLSILKHCFQQGQYSKWMKVGCILKKTLPYEEALEYFLSHSYVAPFDNEKTKQDNIKQFNNWDNTKNGYNKNSLMKFCKEENRDLTLMLFPYENFNGYLKDPTDCCELVDKLKLTIKHTTAYDGINWYSLNDKNLWVVADPEYNITREILRYVDYNYNYLNKQFNEADEDEREKLTDKISILMGFRKQVCNSCNITNKIKKQLSSLILDTDFGKKLDAKVDVWAFENGVLNLKTGKFRKGFRSDDYLTRHLDFEYNKYVDNNKLNYLKEQFKKVLNYDDEHLDYFMSIIGASLTGNSHKLKQMYFGVDGCDGIGNNGKTNTFSIINDIFNIYVYKTNKTLLEEDNKKLHKQMIQTKGMRIVWADEWGKKRPNYELIKTIADGLDYENEIMYGTCEIFKVMFKMFILTNHTPNLSSDEEAVYNRFRQITFGSHFDTQGNTTEENYENLQFIADVSMRENIVNNYKNEMIAWVLEYSKQFLIDYKLPCIPAKFANDTKDTKNSNDLFRQIIEDDYEEGDEDDYVSIYDLMIKSKIRDDKNGKKKIINKMKQLSYKTTYNKDKQVNKKKGVFYGIREILDED